MIFDFRRLMLMLTNIVIHNLLITVLKRVLETDK